MKRKLAALVVLLVIAAGAVAMTFGGFGAAAATITQYLSSPATTGDVSEDVAATGSLAAETTYGLVFGTDPYIVANSSATAPQASRTWSVTDVRVKAGDSVKKGQVLATAAITDARRDLAAATRDLRTANINLATAEDDYSTAKDSGTTSRINQAKIALYAAQSQTTKASQTRNDLLREIKAATLRSPIDGVVTAVNVMKGFDAPSGAAVTIATPTLTVTTDVVESDLASIKAGQAASVTVSAISATLSGTVTSIAPTATTSQSNVVSYPVTITIKDAPATARAGMSADVTITTASATNVLTVPASALQGTRGDYSVLVLAADGSTSRVSVQVGLVTNARAEIKSGLTEGTNVVTGTTADLVGSSNNGGFGRGGFGVPGGAVQRVEGPNVKVGP
jgi:macrolide-specific efflux system membrane fusion protein